MKNTKKIIHLLTFCSLLAAAVVLCGCASVPKTCRIVTRISQPPPGKALVNFHRPSSYGKPVGVPIFDINGKMLVDMRGASLFQVVCDPGETVFIGWAEHVTVIKADVAPDKIYDIMVDVAPGWVYSQHLSYSVDQRASQAGKVSRVRQTRKVDHWHKSEFAPCCRV